MLSIVLQIVVHESFETVEILRIFPAFKCVVNVNLAVTHNKDDHLEVGCQED